MAENTLTMLAIGTATLANLDTDDAATWMSADAQARMTALVSPRRRNQFAAGRWLARQLLMQELGGSLEGWQLSAGQNSAPAVMGRADLTLSVSHSGDLGACAVADTPVGIDIEISRDRSGMPQLFDAVLTGEERAWLATLPATEQVTAFFTVWTLKEAWLKRTGNPLFQTMLHGGATVRPATSADANAVSWRYGEAIVSLSLPDASAAGQAAATPALDFPSGHSQSAIRNLWHVTAGA